MRHIVATLLFLGSIALPSFVAAQGPFGRLGPGGAFRAMMPPIPAPPVPVRPSYVRVPGVAVGPSVYITPFGPAYVGYRPAPVVAATVAVRPATYPGRIAVATPTTSVPSSLVPSVRPAATTAAARGTASGDLQPGMVLPDGAVVVSVGPVRNAPTVEGSTTVAKPSVAPPSTSVPSPVPPAVAPGTRSILETEELPLPQPAPSATPENPTIRQF